MITPRTKFTEVIEQRQKTIGKLRRAMYKKDHRAIRQKLAELKQSNRNLIEVIKK